MLIYETNLSDPKHSHHWKMKSILSFSRRIQNHQNKSSILSVSLQNILIDLQKCNLLKFSSSFLNSYHQQHRIVWKTQTDSEILQKYFQQRLEFNCNKAARVLRMFDKSSPKNFAHSNVFQCSPTKLTIDLKEARRLYRSRNRSIENLKIEKINKDKINRDVYDLQSTWNELQYQRKKDDILNLNKERSSSKNSHIIEKELSPKPKKGIQLYSRIQTIELTSPKKEPHRAQIYLPANKYQIASPFESPIQEPKQIDFAMQMQIRNTQINPQSHINSKPFEYFNKIFSHYAPYKKTMSTPPKKKQKKYNIGDSGRSSIEKERSNYIGISSPTNLAVAAESYCRHSIKEAFSKQMKRLKIKRINSQKEEKSNSSMRISAKLFDSNMQIESILFQKNSRAF